MDFVSFLTEDIPRAKRFYSETLGLAIESEGTDDMEFRAGQVTLDIFNPASQGQPFAPSLGGMALRVPDVDAARADLEARESSSTARRGRSVCRMAFFHDPDGNLLMLHRGFDA